ncbi:MAG TPA: ABC transporter permease subunit [Candidatus Eisenbacteria bacterium]|nr:ABC transporter permease subunit [Candidatus Eisenbacteria bacterium]
MSENSRAALWRLLLIFAALAIFEASVRANWIDPFFAASPVQAVRELASEIAHGGALRLFLITLYEIGCALLISTVVGLIVGFVLWRYRLIGAGYEMILAALFSSPVILAYPVFLVAFGRSAAAVIALSSVLGLIPIIMNTKTAFQQVNPILLQVGASMNLSRSQMFRYILLPAVAPTIFAGFRLGLTYILKSVLGLEYVIQVGGVGMWLSDAAFRFEVTEVYAGLTGTVLLSILFLYLINRAELLVRR